jgi:hypothetical protein
MDPKIEKIVDLIQRSELDQTIKDILVRDLKADGLNDFLKEQIKAYCSDAIKKVDSQITEIDQLLGDKNPS